jgi:3-oxoacyl-[acyl-carrier-protein] synthase II
MLETEESAGKRGTHPTLELCGFGCAHDANSMEAYNVRADGAAAAIRLALASADIPPEAIACIIASANGSRTGDCMEARALERIFGDRLREIPVCAPKAAFGECLGASGALLAITAGLALNRQAAPPTAGLERYEYGLRLSSKPEPFKGEYALVNCFGCDGNNAALVVKRM